MMGKLREGNQFILQINGSLSSPLNMTLFCISFNQLGIHLVSEFIHFHDSCHSFEYFKECIVHCRVVFRLIKSMSPSLRLCHLTFKREIVLRVYTCSQNNFFLSQLPLSQSSGYIILKSTELCSDFHVIDVGFIMALLRKDYSCRHQLIIQ